LVGDGSGSGKMTMGKLSGVLKCITKNSDVVGFTIAEFLPFDEHKLHKMFRASKYLVFAYYLELISILNEANRVVGGNATYLSPPKLKS